MFSLFSIACYFPLSWIALTMSSALAMSNLLLPHTAFLWVDGHLQSTAFPWVDRHLQSTAFLWVDGHLQSTVFPQGDRALPHTVFSQGGGLLSHTVFPWVDGSASDCHVGGNPLLPVPEHHCHTDFHFNLITTKANLHVLPKKGNYSGSSWPFFLIQWIFKIQVVRVCEKLLLVILRALYWSTHLERISLC